jgi:hypothetical protein
VQNGGTPTEAIDLHAQGPTATLHFALLTLHFALHLQLSARS